MRTGYKSLRRKKTGGRRKGTPNKRTIEKVRKAEMQIADAHAGRIKIAVDHMDDMIEFFRALIGTTLVPWSEDGTRNGRDEKLWFRAVEVFQSFLNMRAPFQSPRLTAIGLMPQQSKRVTHVNVTILDERGETEYSDAPEDKEPKLIEHVPGDEEAA